jgi:hypothetical protein
MHVSSVSSIFRRMLQLFHLDVLKVYRMYMQVAMEPVVGHHLPLIRELPDHATALPWVISCSGAWPLRMM